MLFELTIRWRDREVPVLAAGKVTTPEGEAWALAILGVVFKVTLRRALP